MGSIPVVFAIPSDFSDSYAPKPVGFAQPSDFSDSNRPVPVGFAQPLGLSRHPRPQTCRFRASPPITAGRAVASGREESHTDP